MFWPALPRQQVAVPSTPPDRSRVCVPSGGVPCRGILIRVGRVCLGILGRTFSSDGCSFAATFPWKQTVALGHLKSLDTENQPEVKCLTQGHRPRVRKLACLRKHTHTHTQTRHSHDISVLLADSQGGSNLIFGLDCGQESGGSGRQGLFH